MKEIYKAIYFNRREPDNDKVYVAKGLNELLEVIEKIKGREVLEKYSKSYPFIIFKRDKNGEKQLPLEEVSKKVGAYLKSTPLVLNKEQQRS